MMAGATNCTHLIYHYHHVCDVMCNGFPFSKQAALKKIARGEKIEANYRVCGGNIKKFWHEIEREEKSHLLQMN